VLPGTLLTELVAYEPGKGFVLLGDLNKLPAAKALNAIRAGVLLEGAGLVCYFR
jgi:hypothetical protein